MLEIITGLQASNYNHHGMKQNLVEWARPFLTTIKKLQRIMDPRLNLDYPSKGASRAAELILSCLDQDPKNRPSMDQVVSGLQGVNAIKIKPSQFKLKSKANTGDLMSICNEQRSSNCYHQSHHWSPVRPKQGRGVWSTSSRLFGLEMCIGLKQDQEETWNESKEKTGEIKMRNREKFGWSLYAL